MTNNHFKYRWLSMLSVKVLCARRALFGSVDVELLRKKKKGTTTLYFLLHKINDIGYYQ